MIKQDDVIAALDKLRGDAILVPTMTATAAVIRQRELTSRDLPVSGAMGKGSSVALGLALAQPDTKVIVIDADGSLAMNLGSLATIAGVKPKNLVHFVMHNGMYSVTGGQPIPAKEVISFTSMAEGAGYAATYEFDDLEDFTVQLDEIMKLQGPVFVTIKAVPEVQNEPIAQRVRSPRARTTTEAMALMHAELTA